MQEEAALAIQAYSAFLQTIWNGEDGALADHSSWKHCMLFAKTRASRLTSLALIPAVIVTDAQHWNLLAAGRIFQHHEALLVMAQV